MASSDRSNIHLCNENTLIPSCTEPDNTPMSEHEKQLVQCLKFWVDQHPKKPIDTPLPTTHNELLSFIAKLFIAFQKDEQQTWLQMGNLHLLPDSVLKLYQKKCVQVQTMNWIQLLCYKAVECPNIKHCRSFREQKMLHNQFYDFELECPFYHDKKDRRRIIFPEEPQEEFMYKGKYQEGISEENMNPGYSHNYFESVYHPLFYKFFDCKRVQCRGSIYCPMKHADEERIAWEEEFSMNWRKDRSIYYPKKKKGTWELSDNNSQEDRMSRANKNRSNAQKSRKGYNNSSSGYNNNNNQNGYNKLERNDRENVGERISNFQNNSTQQFRNLDFFEVKPEKESKFMKFFYGDENTQDNSQKENNSNLLNKSPSAQNNFFNILTPKTHEEQSHPFFNFENTLTDSTSQNQNSQKKIGFFNGKKASNNQYMQRQGDMRRIEVR